MKAPDKIVMPEATSQLRFTMTESVEYIRKDALLGWLNGKVYEHNEDRFDDGFNAALGQVIDKIISL